MQAGALVVSMDTISFNHHPPTLDAVLGGMAYQETFDGPAAARVPEVARWGDTMLPMASRGILVGATDTTKRTHTRSFTRHMVANPSIIRASTNEPWRKDIQKTPYGKIEQNTNTIYSITAMVFIAICEPDAVLERFARHPTMGTNRKDHGEIKSVEWIDLTLTATTGLIGEETLLRPIPATILHKIKADVASVASYGYWHNPYNPKVARQAGVGPDAIHSPVDFIRARTLEDALAYGNGVW